jgi:cation:H+ antiporter
VVFTHWDLRRGHGETLVSAVLALASALLVLAWVKIKKTLNPYVLMAGGAFYGIFILYLVLR